MLVPMIEPAGAAVGEGVGEGVGVGLGAGAAITPPPEPAVLDGDPPPPHPKRNADPTAVRIREFRRLTACSRAGYGNRFGEALVKTELNLMVNTGLTNLGKGRFRASLTKAAYRAPAMRRGRLECWRTVW